MAQITNIKGETKEISCLSCAIVKGDVESAGAVLRTKHFDAHQDYEIPIPGFIILSSLRHLQSVDQFTDEEKADFMDALTKIRKAMREVLDIQVVYMVQEEDTSAHFHVWLFPRYDWMLEKFGRKIQSVRPIMEHAREKMKTEENLDTLTVAVKKLKDSLSRV